MCKWNIKVILKKALSPFHQCFTQLCQVQHLRCSLQSHESSNIKKLATIVLAVVDYPFALLALSIFIFDDPIRQCKLLAYLFCYPINCNIFRIYKTS